MNTKQQILDLATEKFSTFGYSKVSMDEIASALAISKKTLYKHYSSKQELLSATVDQFIAELTTDVEKLYDNTKYEYYEKVTAVFTLVGTKLSSISPFFIADINRNAPEVMSKLRAFKQEAAYRRFARLLDEGIKAGKIKKGVNKNLALVLYSAAIDTVINPHFTRHIPIDIADEVPYTPTAVFEGLVKIIFEGILV